MKLFLYLFFISTTIVPAFSSTKKSLVKCPCLHGFENECISREYCVYGINDAGEIYFNGKNDEMNLTNVALMRKEEIKRTIIGHENDDVLVNLYSPKMKPEIIFYYGCRKCNDLKVFGRNITVSKMKIFLLSLYNQRMKLNIKYSQSDFQYYSDPSEDVQLMPEISVRPFWKNRLMFNQSCANKHQEFTQKHFIPAFLTQDFCILDYKYVQHLPGVQGSAEFTEWQTTNGEITYSLTLSTTDLYAYDIIITSSTDLPPEFQDTTDRCKSSFSLDAKKRFIRYFCLCDNPTCTLNITSRNPENFCPSQLALQIDTTEKLPKVLKTTYFVKPDELFFENGDNHNYCFFAWRTHETLYDFFIRNTSSSLPIGIQNDYMLSRPKGFGYCPLINYTKEKVDPLRTRYYNNTANDLQYVFLNVTSDHTKIINDKNSPVGANCSFEGTLSDPFFSSAYAANSSSFPCYQYYNILTGLQIYPMMGINLMPITVLKGKECYYYTVKVEQNHFFSCAVQPPQPLGLSDVGEMPPVFVLSACPEHYVIDQKELHLMNRLSTACPTMKPGESKWRYQSSGGILCGQILRGLKFENGKYVPDKVEFREITTHDLIMVGMKDVKQNIDIRHGCGFNASQQLTICTCFAALGGCDNLYMVGRIHLLRYLPFNN